MVLWTILPLWPRALRLFNLQLLEMEEDVMPLVLGSFGGRLRLEKGRLG